MIRNADRSPIPFTPFFALGDTPTYLSLRDRIAATSAADPAPKTTEQTQDAPQNEMPALEPQYITPAPQVPSQVRAYSAYKAVLARHDVARHSAGTE